MWNKEVEVCNIFDYLKVINEIKEQCNFQDNKNLTLFFRGQKNNSWEVQSSIARNGIINKEEELLQLAKSKCSSFLETNDNYFDLLTKLQHYGLPTRLLDVTTNPLVALYFSCSDNRQDGVVFCGEDYITYTDSLDIQIISFLCFQELQSKTLEDILQLLLEKGYYSKKEYENCIASHYKSLIELLQSTYLVQPNYNNERINRQSGAFILPAMYNFHYDDNKIEKSHIVRAKQDLSSSFHSKITILKNFKTKILEDLNFYNINKASLFPELDYQLSYLKDCIESRCNKDVEIFSKSIFLSAHGSLQFVAKIGAPTIIPIIQSQVDSKNEVKVTDYLKEILTNRVNLSGSEINELKTIKFIDWYKKESLISQLKLELRDLLKDKIDKKELKVTIDNIMKELQSKINEQNNIIDVEPNILSPKE